MDLIINLRNGVYITRLIFDFLSNRAITGFPLDSLRLLLEKIMPMLNKNIIITNTRIVRNIVTINIGKFNLMLTIGLNQIFG